MKKVLILLVVGFFSLIPLVSFAATTVPGHTDRWDEDGNGIPDEGVIVNGHYTSVYAYDYDAANDLIKDWYWDLGDGRIMGTVGSIDELDESTLTICNYVNNYRATFENDPYMDSGWITNNINCSGYDDNNTYLYLIVHETDPRYTGNPDWAIWGTWEYHVLSESGNGNLVVRPYTAP